MKYFTVENNGQVNLDVRNGSIRFLYQQFWSSTGVGVTGRGPRQWARLMSLGEPTTPPTGWFDLAISNNPATGASQIEETLKHLWQQVERVDVSAGTIIAR